VAVIDADGDAPPASRAAAVFLVPQGREHEWLFGSPEGQRALAASAGASRLAIVAFGRPPHAFGDAKAVQADLSPLVLPLAPAAARAAAASGVGAPIPFMTTTDGIGARAHVASLESALSGTILVEEVQLPSEGGDDDAPAAWARRMVFSANASLVQSEVRLRGGRGGTVDGDTLACEYHAAMLAGLAVAAPALAAARRVGGGADDTSDADDAALPRVMVIGLGGGALPSFLAAHFRVHVHVVELDAAVATLASAHFGFTPGNRLSLTVGDGVAAVAAAAPASLDAILLDAGSSDASLGMTCPPPVFLEPPFLAAAAAALKPSGGVLAVNCVSRSAPRFLAALAALRAVFPCLLQAEAEAAHLNRVVFACTTGSASGASGMPAAATGPGPARAAAAALRAAATAPFDNDMDLETLAEGMHALTVGGGGGDIEALD
jgi:hypothetical protein